MKKLLALALISTALWSSMVTFQGKKVTLNNSGLKIGQKAPIFYGVNNDLKEVKVGGKSDKIQIIAFVPSLDTGICKLETIAFNKKISKMKNVVVKVVSKDLPFAMGRFCKDNKITNVMTISDYKDDNHALRYGTTITSPAFLEGFFGRVVYIVDKKGIVRYKQIVPKIEIEPNYKAIFKALSKI